METNPKQIDVKYSHTLENNLEIDPERSIIPILLSGDRVIVEPITAADDQFLSKEANITKSLDMKEKFKKGKVVSIGGGEYGLPIPPSMKVGMVVNYFHTTAIDWILEKKTYHLVRASDCWGYL